MYSATSELFEFNKMLLIYIITAGIALGWAITLILRRKHFVQNRFLTTIYLLFLTSQIISTFVSIDVHTSIFGYYGRFNGGLLSIAAYIILFFAFMNFMDVKQILSFLRLSVLTSIIVILWGIPGKLGYDLSCFLFTHELSNNCWTAQFRPAERMFSTLGQPNWMGAYLAIHFFIALFFLIVEIYDLPSARNKFLKWILTGYLMLNFLAVLYTRSRSALLSVAVGLVVFAAYYSYLRWRDHHFAFPLSKNWYYVVAGLTVVLIFGKTGVPSIDKFITLPHKVDTAVAPATPAVKAAPTTDVVVDTGVTDSFDIRKIVWQGAQELGNRYPLFGTGVETFAYAYYFVRPVQHNLTSEWDYLYNKAHNEFYNYLATTGYIGLITYLALIFGTYYVGTRLLLRARNSQEKHPLSVVETKLLAVALMSAYTTIHVTNFVGFSTSTVNIFFYLIPAMLVLLDKSFLPAHALVERDYAESPATWQKILIGCSSLVFLASFVFIVLYFMADLKFSQADAYTQQGDYQSAATVMQDALNLHYEHVYEDKLSNSLANLAYVAAYQKNAELAKQLMQLSEYYNKKSIAASSKNVLYWKTRAKNNYLYFETTTDLQYLKEAIAAVEIAENLSPTDAKLAYTQSLFYDTLAQDEKDKVVKDAEQKQAIEQINKSVNLKTNYQDAYVLQGQLLKKYGQKEQAKKVFQFVLDHFDAQNKDVLTEMKDL